MSELSLPLPGPAALRAVRFCTDAQLVARAAGGDERAFGEIFARYHQDVYRYCRSILGDAEDAADALQNTMASVLGGLDGETREIALKPWLFRIAHNEALSIIRRARPQVELEDAQPCPRGGVEGGVLASERFREVVADVQALPDRQRGALVMRELSGLEYVEIAAVFAVAEGAARQAVHEARGMLHELAEGRAMACADVRELISARDGRLLRGRKVRAHLRACESCTQFRAAIGQRQAALSLAAPPLAAPLAASILGSLFGGGHGGSAAGAGASAGAAAASSTAPIGHAVALSGLSAKAAAGVGLATKAAVVIGAAAALGGGAIIAEHEISGQRPLSSEPVPQSRSGSLDRQSTSTSRGAGAARVAAGVVAPVSQRPFAVASSAHAAGTGPLNASSVSAGSKHATDPASRRPVAVVTPFSAAARRPVSPSGAAPKRGAGATATNGRPTTSTSTKKPTTTPTRPSSPSSPSSPSRQSVPLIPLVLLPGTAPRVTAMRSPR